MDIRLYMRGLWWTLTHLMDIKHFIGRQTVEHQYDSPQLKTKMKKLGIKDITIIELLQMLGIKYRRYPVKAQGTVKWVVRDYEMQIIMNVASSNRFKTIFEIGTFVGRTTLNLSTHKHKKIYTIDLPQREADLRYKKPEKYTVGRLIKKCKNVTQLYGDTISFDFSPYKNMIDLFFIDGCHEYDYAKSDTSNALSCLRKKGVIIFHDFQQFNMTRSGIMDAILDDKSFRGKLFQIMDTTILVLMNK